MQHVQSVQREVDHDAGGNDKKDRSCETGMRFAERESRPSLIATVRRPVVFRRHLGFIGSWDRCLDRAANDADLASALQAGVVMALVARAMSSHRGARDVRLGSFGFV